jgi:hypothetical protein
MDRMMNSPERQLWCAVLDRAMQDAADHVAAAGSDPARRRLRSDAQRWFAEAGTDYRYVCESAGIDPDELRSRMLRRGDTEMHLAESA